MRTTTHISQFDEPVLRVQLHIGEASWWVDFCVTCDKTEVEVTLFRQSAAGIASYLRAARDQIDAAIAKCDAAVAGGAR